MGVVYRARDIRLNRDVALKFLPLELSRDEEAKRRCMQEAQAASSSSMPTFAPFWISVRPRKMTGRDSSSRCRLTKERP